MTRIDESQTRSEGVNPHLTINLLLLLFGFLAPTLTFVLAVADLSIRQKTAGLVILAVLYAAICAWSFFHLRRINSLRATMRLAAKETDPEVDVLTALDDAQQFYGSSLRPADMFRLVSSRVKEILPHRASVLYIRDEGSTSLSLTEVEGLEESEINELRAAADSSQPGVVLLSGEAEAGECVPLSDANGGRAIWSAAIPLVHDEEVFGIFQLITRDRLSANEETLTLLESVGERISPLFLGSLAFARTLSSALTDPLTRLPNERALYLVLENQLAESQRFRDERPLTVVAVDIQGFETANERFGHALGDRMLSFVAETIRPELRKMDFLARLPNDEFMIVLPTATEQMAGEVVERIKRKFTSTAFPISEFENPKVWLNFGLATFWKDGEDADQLVRAAQRHKQRSKSEDPDNVIWFPREKEYVN
jgi:diguanylate cyclase (GGDEF)-like protein